MKTLKTQKDIQSLTGRVAALTRFISKATDKCVPFFKTLKGGTHQIAWTPKCDQAFQDLKNYMSRAPLLSKSLPGEVLILYLSVSSTAVSSVLIRKPEKAELPIFYVSKVLQSAELRYPPLEQLALALHVLQKPETSGRLVKWAIELGEFDIQFKPRPTEKGQAVADFISELTPFAPSETSFLNAQGYGAGLVLTTPDGSKVEYALRFNFRTSNNEAELRSEGCLHVRLPIGSPQLLQKFQAYEIRQINRSENSHADALSRLASAINDRIRRTMPVEILSHPSTTTAEVCTVRYKDTWMSPIYAFLTNGTLPTDKSQARKLRYRSARYTVIDDVLYKRDYTMPYLKCLTKEQGDYVLREVHSGVCGDHSGSRSLAHKVFRQGYFWPTLHQDANVLVKKCDKCQRFGSVPHIPAEPLSPIVSPWPFAQWGLDLIGLMSQGKGQVKYVVVAVDYFTK
ncbi:unnamed protein product [Prunus armeniaca]